MTDPTVSEGSSATSICPWCSAAYSGAPENCPSCGATLTGDAAADPSLPGLTTIDAAAIVSAKMPVKRSRSRLLSWISGDYPEETSNRAEASALAPPDLDVRREILRLELEAEVANLQAEADAMRADAAVEGQADSELVPAAAAAAEGAGIAEAPVADVTAPGDPVADPPAGGSSGSVEDESSGAAPA